MRTLITVLVLTDIGVYIHIPQLVSWTARSPLGKAASYSVDKDGAALKWYREHQKELHANMKRVFFTEIIGL